MPIPRPTSLVAVLLVALVAGGLLPLAAWVSRALAATTFVVNGTPDLPDADLGDGRCDALSAPIGDQCTPRAAMEQANATAGGTTIARGLLTSTPGQSYVLRFVADPVGQNEGRIFLGQQSATTKAGGNADFTFVRTPAVASGQAITATATGPGGNTSEFSPPRTVAAG